MTPESSVDFKSRLQTELQARKHKDCGISSDQGRKARRIDRTFMSRSLGDRKGPRTGKFDKVGRNDGRREALDISTRDAGSQTQRGDNSVLLSLMSVEEKELTDRHSVRPDRQNRPFANISNRSCVTLIMAIFGMTFILQAVTVPTGSMQNTILIGDYLLVNKFIFTPGGGSSLPFLPQREIKRGDIIVFKYPGNKLHPEMDRSTATSATPYQINYVKRVIGLPGETVEFRDNQVFINGKLLPEHRMIGDADDNQSALRRVGIRDAAS